MLQPNTYILGKRLVWGDAEVYEGYVRLIWRKLPTQEFLRTWT